MELIEAMLRRGLFVTAIVAAFGFGGAGGLSIFVRYVAAPALPQTAPMADAAFIAMAEAALDLRPDPRVAPR